MPALDAQLLAVTIMFLAGVGLALASDLTRIVSGRLDVTPVGATEPATNRRPRRPRRVRRRAGLNPWDLVLWLLITPLLFVAAVAASGGEPRVHVFAGAGLGVAAYALLARRVILAAGAVSRQAILRVGGAATRKVAAPVSAAGKRVSRAAHERGTSLSRWGRARRTSFTGWMTARRAGLATWSRGRPTAWDGWAKRGMEVLKRLTRGLREGFGPTTKE